MSPIFSLESDGMYSDLKIAALFDRIAQYRVSTERWTETYRKAFLVICRSSISKRNKLLMQVDRSG